MTEPIPSGGAPVLTSAGKRKLVDALPPRVAHAVHALIVATAEHPPMPRTAAEVCIYDAPYEALSGRHTAAALREASKLGLAWRTLSGGYWIPSTRALNLKSALEERALRDEDAA